MKNENLQILTAKNVAEFMNISLVTLWRLAKKDDFPSKIKVSARRIGYSKEEVIKWLENRRI